MKQRLFYREWAYLAGILAMAFGAAFMEHAGFGLSMVVAPAYLLHRASMPMLSWFSFGVAEIVFQAILLAVLCLILRSFRFSFFFSFVTSVIYGCCLDGAILLVEHLPYTLAMRIVLYIAGMVITSAGVAFFCYTYIAPEVYELFVVKVSKKFRKPFHFCKTVYDCLSCLLSLILSFTLFGFGEFVGVNWGTIVCALVNGTLIGLFEKLYDRLWRFEDKFPKLRRIMP